MTSSTSATTAIERSSDERRACFERNINALHGRDRDLRDALTAATPADVKFFTAPDGSIAAEYAGRPLCSRHRPAEEAARLIDPLDLVEHAVFVVAGFGVGHHVVRLAERLDKGGVIVVFEPDVGLLRAVFEHVDCSTWMADAPILWLTSATDRASLAMKLDGSESIIAQGVEIVTPPASRARLGDRVAALTDLVREYVSVSKTLLMTTLMRSTCTTQNLLLNMDHYAGGAPLEPLRGSARGATGLVVSAGPSLARSLALLSEPGIRERCVIIAVQTTLKPLLNAGIRPHFVTALDYHEISKRFYEGLTSSDVEGITLVADPKAHPVILDSWPGSLRCCRSPFLDRILKPLTRSMGELPSGATVSHLAFYLADFLGCNPVALVGQDLGFTDGLYYAPGNPIHEIWAPELNPFNTLAMMEWKRIVRHRSFLQKIEDQSGRQIYTDSQMLSYLKQFERDFLAYKEHDLRIINATGGGARIEHAEGVPLEEVLSSADASAVPEFPQASPAPDAERLASVDAHLGTVRDDVVTIEQVSRKTVQLIDKMFVDQTNPAKMKSHFAKMDTYRAEVDRRFETFQIINQLNQLGVYKRLKADRRLTMSEGLDAIERQRAQLERDRENVDWLADAAIELLTQLDESRRVIGGEAVMPRRTGPEESSDGGSSAVTAEADQVVGALIAVDVTRDFFGRPRSLATSLPTTIRRLLTSASLSGVFLLVRDDEFDAVEPLLTSLEPDERTFVTIVSVGDALFDGRHEWIRAARAWSEHSWRGGLGTLTVFDELIVPEAMLATMRAHDLDAAYVVGPDWPLVQMDGACGGDALIARHRQAPEQNNLVFTQSPPGLCGCVIGRDLMEKMAEQSGNWSLGAILGYAPERPQHDPVAKELNVQVDPRVRQSLGRFTANRDDRVSIIESLDDDVASDGVAIVQEIGERLDAAPFPDHLILELTTLRDSHGLHAQRMIGSERPERPEACADRIHAILEGLGEIGCPTVTFDGTGDPLLHPELPSFIRKAREAGARSIQVRTELRAQPAAIEAMMAARPDVLTFDLHATTAATYRTMMGDDRFDHALQMLQIVADHREAFRSGSRQWMLPWIVPVMQRCNETFDEINDFFDHWLRLVGAAVIEHLPGEDRGERYTGADDVTGRPPLTPAQTPERVIRAQLARRLFVLSDGSVPVDERDLHGTRSVGTLSATRDVHSAWEALRTVRRDCPLESLGLIRS